MSNIKAHMIASLSYVYLSLSYAYAYMINIISTFSDKFFLNLLILPDWMWGYYWWLFGDDFLKIFIKSPSFTLKNSYKLKASFYRDLSVYQDGSSSSNYSLNLKYLRHLMSPHIFIYIQYNISDNVTRNLYINFCINQYSIDKSELTRICFNQIYLVG